MMILRAATILLLSLLLSLSLANAAADETPAQSAAAVEPSREAMFTALAAAAGSGNAEIKYNLGMFYNGGIGTPQDTHKAFQYFTEAAAGGSLLASYKVGCYFAGQFSGVVARDDKSALSYKLAAAQGGYALAQHDVALAFARQQDMPTALLWWERASRQGHAPATAQLARYYSAAGAQHQARAWAMLLVLREQLAKAPDQLQEQIAASRARLSAAQTSEAEQLRAGWTTGPTPLTLSARAGIAAVPALLGAPAQLPGS